MTKMAVLNKDVPGSTIEIVKKGTRVIILAERPQIDSKVLCVCTDGRPFSTDISNIDKETTS